MSDLLRKYLLSSVAFQAPDSETGAADGDVPELDPEDDEETTDPAGEPDDEGEDEAGADDKGSDGADAAGEDEPRGRRQFGELRATNRELAKQNAEITRRLAELEGRGAQQYQQPQETPQQRANRLSLLSPEERIHVELQERDQFYQHQNRQLSLQVQDSGDKASFASLTVTNPVAKRFSSEVDRLHAEYKAKGAFVERAVILKQIIGERVLAQGGKPKKQAAANRQRQASRPAGSGSDVRPSRGRAAAGSAEDFESRFGDIQI